MNIGKMLADIAKSKRDSALGRIHSYEGNWVFVRDLRDNTDGRFERPDADGIPMAMIGQRSVRCPHNKWQNQKPRTRQGEKSLYWVPRSQCQRCEFYRKREKGISFSRCAFKATAATRQEAAIQGVKAMGEAWNNATDFANGIIGKRPDDSQS